MTELKEDTRVCASDNVALRPMVRAHLINPLAGTYKPSRDNPQENVRPGADDHKQHKSLSAQGHAVYRRHHV